MKNITFLIFLLITFISKSQTATDFTCNDCDGNSINLFNQLDSGKVVVLCWVMPCSSCIPASKTTYNIIESYQSAHSGKVLFYLCDDYANTSCASLNSWANSNSIPASAFSKRFSNTSIDMLHYGASGMPKIVVVAGNEHKVMYNANNTVDIAELQTAINQGLNANLIQPNEKDYPVFRVIANYSEQIVNLIYGFNDETIVNFNIYNSLGEKLTDEKLFFNALENSKSIDISKLPAGYYILTLYNSNYNKAFKLLKQL